MSQSVRRKAKRRMYKKLKKEGRLIKPQTKSTIPLKQLTSLATLHGTPKVKKAIARVVEFEMKRPGEFSKWLEDLHIEHFRAGFQERINAAKAADTNVASDSEPSASEEIARRQNEQEKSSNPEKQAAAENEVNRPKQNQGLEERGDSAAC